MEAPTTNAFQFCGHGVVRWHFVFELFGEDFFEFLKELLVFMQLCALIILIKTFSNRLFFGKLLSIHRNIMLRQPNSISKS